MAFLRELFRFFVWILFKIFYRIRVTGLKNIPRDSGALLVSNHVSWLDGIFLQVISPHPLRLIIYAGNYRNPLSRWIVRNLWRSILIEQGPKSIIRALKTAKKSALDGDLVCIFPEGGLTRNAQLQAFRPGLMKIVQGTKIPVVPVYLDELWGSIFSFDRGRFFWKWPRRFPYSLSIHIGTPVVSPRDTHEIRQAVSQLGTQAVENRKERMMVLPQTFIRQCKRRKFQSKVADSSGVNLTGGSLLMRTMILRRLLLREVIDDSEKYVGVLLPPTVAGVAVNMALALSRRIAVNLNYTVSSKVMNHCIAQCGIKHVLTSRKFMEKIDFDLDVELVYLEDFRERATISDKLSCALKAYLVPAKILGNQFELHKIKADDLLTVIFTSGSTGTPKGVMLTHANVASNAEVIDQIIHLRKSDVLIGILPFFHSFGYTVTLWTPMSIDMKSIYHFSPLDGKQVGKLCLEHQGTVLLSTPTFLRTYLRRCSPQEFATLDVVVTGAERLPVELADAFEKKFGLRPVEGYGTTELSPLAAVNIPPSRSIDNFQVDRKEGTVGRPVPGVSAKVIDLETGEPLGVDKPGMLLIKGPNVMKGYLGMPEKTAEVIKEGWYVTGDVAVIDDEGFIKITGRESRFSKIGGEMVPHIQIEETLAKIIGVDEEEGLKIAVTAVPDAKKGERLIVIHTELEQSPQQLCESLAQAGLPNIYIPSPDSFCQVDELPILGTGKLDLKGIRSLASERFSVSQK